MDINWIADLKAKIEKKPSAYRLCSFCSAVVT